MRRDVLGVLFLVSNLLGKRNRQRIHGPAQLPLPTEPILLPRPVVDVISHVDVIPLCSYRA